MKRNSLWGSKKGFLGIVVLLIVALVVFGIVNLVVYKAFDSTNDMLQDDPDMTNTSKAVVQDLEDRYPATMDGAFITVLGLFLVLGLVLAWFSDTSPLFMVLAVLFMIFLLLGGAVLSNVWGDFSADSEVSSLVVEFPMTNWILDNYLIVSLIIIGSMLFAMFLKSRLT